MLLLITEANPPPPPLVCGAGCGCSGVVGLVGSVGSVGVGGCVGGATISLIVAVSVCASSVVLTGVVVS